jgi:hypothetical protein
MIVVPVDYVRTVKKVVPTEPDGSVRCIGLCLCSNPTPRLLSPLPVLPFFGAIGLAATSDASG